VQGMVLPRCRASSRGAASVDPLAGRQRHRRPWKLEGVAVRSRRWRRSFEGVRGWKKLAGIFCPGCDVESPVRKSHSLQSVRIADRLNCHAFFAVFCRAAPRRLFDRFSRSAYPQFGDSEPVFSVAEQDFQIAR
jgi:hypothetical protein